MKKLFLILITLLIPVFVISAQDLKTEYYNQIDTTLSDLTAQYLKMQGVQSLRVTIKGDFNGKRARIIKVTCNNGVFAENEKLQEYQHFIMTDSIETLDFMAMPYGKDSLRIACFYPASYNTKLFEDTVRIDNMKILLETKTSSPGQTPLMAYSTGLPIKGGGVWFCGLRDSGVPPTQWYEKYGIDDYIYYYIRLEDDTPPSADAPIYMKIAKKGAFASHVH